MEFSDYVHFGVDAAIGLGVAMLRGLMQRSVKQIDDRLDALSRGHTELDLSKASRTVVDDIKEDIRELRASGDSHHRETNERLDRILNLVASHK